MRPSSRLVLALACVLLAPAARAAGPDSAAAARRLAGQMLLSAGMGELPEPPAELPVAIALPAARARLSTSFPDAFVLEDRLVLPLPGTDFDRDGLVDAAEARLAQAFRPYFIFDSREQSRLPHEPVSLFQVRPLGCAGPPSRCGGAPLKLALVYVQLWRDDGGYPHLLGFGGHQGDNQIFTVEIEGDAGQTFRIVKAGHGQDGWPLHAARFMNGTHPWLFFSGGKHHQFLDTSRDGRASEASVIFPEALDGRGAAFLAELRGPDGSWNNVGEPEVTRRRIGPLEAYGFPREHAFGGLDFCGGQNCPYKGNGTATMVSRWRRDEFYFPPGPSVDGL